MGHAARKPDYITMGMRSRGMLFGVSSFLLSLVRSRCLVTPTAPKAHRLAPHVDGRGHTGPEHAKPQLQ